MLTGVRLEASVALILTITGELIIGSPGQKAKNQVGASS